MHAPVLEQLPVLSDPTRARLLAVLDDHELTVGELCDVLQLPQSTVSRHLKTLADAGWVASRREGTSRFYAVARERLPESVRSLWRLVRAEVRRSAASAQDHERVGGVVARRRARSEEFFATAAGQWDHLREELFGATAHLHGLLGWLDDRWVAGDLGCGTGQVSAVIAPLVSRVLAVDRSRDMLQAARVRLRDAANVHLTHGALEALPIPGSTLDAACLMLVLHHVPDPGRVVAEAARVLEPGGRLLAVDMQTHDREDYRHAMGHVWLGFSELQMARLASDAGLEAQRYHALPWDARARGPSLFAFSARKPQT